MSTQENMGQGGSGVWLFLKRSWSILNLTKTPQVSLLTPTLQLFMQFPSKFK